MAVIGEPTAFALWGLRGGRGWPPLYYLCIPVYSVAFYAAHILVFHTVSRVRRGRRSDSA
jgi:hypothetical protein